MAKHPRPPHRTEATVSWKTILKVQNLTYRCRCTEFSGSLLTNWIVAYEN